MATSDDMADQELPASSFSIQCEKKKSHDGEGAARQFVFRAFPRGLGQICMLARAADDQQSTGRYTGVPLSTKSVLQELDVEFVESR